MIKIKHARTADCVVAGFRWHKDGRGELVGSLLLGLYDAEAAPAPRRRDVVVHDGEAAAARRENSSRSARTRSTATRGGSGRAAGESGTRMPGGQSRWSAGKDLSWEPLRIERVCEVGYDHLQGERFRHAAIFKRWRPDKPPAECRYDQLEVTAPFELEKVFGGVWHGDRLTVRSESSVEVRRRGRAAPAPGAAPRARAAGSRARASRC